MSCKAATTFPKLTKEIRNKYVYANFILNIAIK